MCDSYVEERGRSKVDYQSHKLAGEGSSPSPATTFRCSTDVLRFLGKFTYKPGYKLQFWLDGERKFHHEQSIVMNMVVPVPDSTREDQKEINIVFTQAVALLNLIHGGPEYVRHILFDFILKWERHEMDEWFRYDGRMLSNPHAMDKR